MPNKVCNLCGGLNGHLPTDMDKYGAVHPEHRTVVDLAVPNKDPAEQREQLIEQLKNLVEDDLAGIYMANHKLGGLQAMAGVTPVVVDRWNSVSAKLADFVIAYSATARRDEICPNSVKEGSSQVRIHVPQRNHINNNDYDKGWNDCWNAFWSARWERIGELSEQIAHLTTGQKETEENE
jgi:hypothetical protein